MMGVDPTWPPAPVVRQPMRVYVACAAAELERARAFCAAVRTHVGMEVAHDWIAEVDAAVAAGKAESDLTDRERASLAWADLSGVESCDAFVMLMSADMRGRGSYVELGYALALRRIRVHSPAIFVAGGERRTIFTVPGLVRAEHQTDAEVLDALVRLRNERF